ncbi:c-type cytochrome [Pontibaca salina]|uniref:Cytochrome C n=1 Tax=Pontibaca salina TaxID=2795731 RepID=A0A934HS15_9RHOB|nr:cytochrome C [Pontibaca salina]MBI6630382.1 cytochrome C [Pontibaca salina]
MVSRLRNSSFALITLAVVGVTSAAAHIVTEEPWHPASAAYRSMLFMADLEPVPWELVREAYEEPHLAAEITRPAREFFQTEAVKLDQAISEAINAEDRQQLYEVTTRALSHLTRSALDEAAELLDQPGKAYQKALEAQGLYRGFASFVEETDPESGRALGLAWLDLMNAVGSSGISGAHVIAANAQAFDDARQKIESYLIENFEPEQFLPRQTLTPLPEGVVAAQGEVKVMAWLPPGSDLNDQDPFPEQILNTEGMGIDEADVPLITYGDMLFDSPFILGEPARSLGINCSTCHNNGDVNRDFFIPGISHQPGAMDVRGSFFNPMFNDHRRKSLDFPSLRGVRYTAPYGNDGRFSSLAEFTRNVIVNEFAGPEPTKFQLDALVAYMLEIDFLPNSRIDEAGKLTEGASDSELRGEALFRKPFPQMDDKSCASCHIPSAAFVDRQIHNIGSGSETYDGAMDRFYATPTLLGISHTAPYFHDGSLPTIESVVSWFDTRYELELDPQEIADLTAYVTVVGEIDEPYEEFDDKNTEFRVEWEELTAFATTYDAFSRNRDAENASLMLKTVGWDLALDASGMMNMAAKPKVYELAGILGDMRAAVDADDWETADALWETFQEKQDKYDAEMY